MTDTLSGLTDMLLATVGSQVTENRALRQQRVFRSVLSALAEPGTIQVVGHDAVGQVHTEFEFPSVAALEVLDALLDGDVTLWCSDTIHPQVPAWLRFHTGVALHLQSCRAADFVLLSHPSELHIAPQLSQGSADEPEGAATVVVVVKDLTSGVPVTLSGPGIESTRPCSPAGFSVEVWAVLQRQRENFPRGIDILVCCEGTVLGLPRSTRIVMDN
jgi:alpha-D-ribose 1-methylphosphonate 5-triphosphate synthase subunit PhnH